MDENIDLNINMEGSAAVVAFGATCITDSDAITEAGEQIKAFLDDNHPADVVFDFSGVSFFSSQVLGLLLAARARVKEYGGRVCACAVSPRLQRVFKVTNLDRVFVFFPDRPSAVGSVS